MIVIYYYFNVYYVFVCVMMTAFYIGIVFSVYVSVSVVVVVNVDMMMMMK